MRYRFVAAERAAFPVRVLCRVVGASASGFYAWLRRGPGGRERDDGGLARRIAAIVETSRRTYGSPRVHAELRAQGIRVSRKRVERLMREGGCGSALKRGSGALSMTLGGSPWAVRGRIASVAPFVSSRWLLPKGLVVESVNRGADCITVAARSAASGGMCPSCGGRSRRVHSRYRRTPADLPCSGRVLRIDVMVRRFRCTTAACPARIFAERRLGPAIAAPFARRTSRLDGLAHHLGLALGGRPGAGLATRLLLPVSRDTLLRTLRRRAERPDAAASVIGIDDWAWKRGQRYGTLVCDLQRHRIVDLLPDREPATLDAWLAARPGIAIVARDRGGGYGEAVTRVRPEALQVADRWHLLENASAAFLDTVRRLIAMIRRAAGTTVVDPTLLTRAERIQYDGYLRREQTNAAIVDLANSGMAIKAIVRRAGCSRKVVRQVLRGERSDVFRCRTSSLEPWLDRLDREWRTG